MGKKTKNQKKLKANAVHNAEEDYTGVPHSFVFHRGQIGKNVQQLIQDVRRAMEPFTASSLKVRKNNSLKDFVAVAGPLGVTHFLIFSKTETNVNFKFVRLPRGPTLHFRVTQYSLVKDVVSSLKKHRMHEQQFTFPPLLVLNNFGTQGMHVKVMATMFQNMFPSINVHKVNLNTIRRCILINYNSDSELLEFRHYSVKVVPVGMSKGMKKLLQEKFPNMSRWEDISELLVKGANLSESEAEQDGEHNITELPQIYAGRGNMKAQQSAVRLTEIGPRMTLQLVKIEEGINDGKVLHHTFVQKTEEEIKAMLDRREKKLKLKSERKKKQEQDVQRKTEMKEDNKKRSLAGMKRKQPEDGEDDDEVEDPGAQDPAEVSDDDDAEYYRQSVGEEPDKDLLLHGRRKSFAPRQRSGPPQKKFKKSKVNRSEESPSSSGHHKAKFPLHKGAKSPKGQSFSPGKKGQRPFKSPEGGFPNKRPIGKGKKQQMGSKKPRAFDSKDAKMGKKGKFTGGPKTGGRKGKFTGGPKTGGKKGKFTGGPKTGGKKGKYTGGHKTGGPKGKAFRQKKKSS
ncbi:suppressor of SWI4 1 homolog [Hyla sarda]|uniref:suppressor of SWI4 1 homolog n=1 Tax=Hyla sarda TaxID=327740 RepID=UPI0024C340E3|nr:suppressor of SWI4 1 homolog [Hyla sarda]